MAEMSEGGGTPAKLQIVGKDAAFVAKTLSENDKIIKDLVSQNERLIKEVSVLKKDSIKWKKKRSIEKMEKKKYKKTLSHSF